MIFTIDGEDTKDFDDALSIEEEGNLFRVGVHIADVAYYVKQDSAIDKEARRRATSIYYLDQTIPMLPPKLSDFLCSLVPNQDRLTITVSMTFDREGGLISTKIFPSLIRSRYRLTYKQVNSFLAGKRNATAALASALNNLKTLANLIRRDRESRGYVDLDISESVINLAEDGSVRSIKRKFRGESELIVEDLMVMANECVATVLKDAKLPAIFRNHPNPSKERIEYLKMLVDYLKLDGDIKIEERHDPIQFSQVVNGIKEANQLTNFSRSALLRSLERAIYSTTDSEHFGLASGGYLHFTSPIRRYPDLVVHRIIRELIFKRLEGQELQQKILDLSNDLADIALNSSLKERAASELEQDIQTIKRARFYRERIGKSFLAEIVAVDRNLLCCELEDKTIGYLKLSQFNTDFETTNFEARSGETLHFQAGSSI